MMDGGVDGWMDGWMMDDGFVVDKADGTCVIIIFFFFLLFFCTKVHPPAVISPLSESESTEVHAPCLLITLHCTARASSADSWNPMRYRSMSSNINNGNSNDDDDDDDDDDGDADDDDHDHDDDDDDDDGSKWRRFMVKAVGDGSERASEWTDGDRPTSAFRHQVTHSLAMSLDHQVKSSQVKVRAGSRKQSIALLQKAQPGPVQKIRPAQPLFACARLLALVRM